MHAVRHLTTDDALEQAWSASHQRPVFLFKHSLICGTSMVAFEQYQQFAQAVDDAAELTLVEIQPHRPLSNAIAERSGVRHQSPQALLLVDGKVVWSKSHYSITVDSLRQALEAVATPVP